VAKKLAKVEEHQAVLEAFNLKKQLMKEAEREHNRKSLLASQKLLKFAGSLDALELKSPTLS